MITDRVRRTEIKCEETRENCVSRSVIIVALFILRFNGEVIRKCSTHEELRNA